MDTLSIRQDIAATSDIDVDAVLNEYGINAASVTTVLQQNGTIISTADTANVVNTDNDSVEELTIQDREDIGTLVELTNTFNDAYDIGVDNGSMSTVISSDSVPVSTEDVSEIPEAISPSPTVEALLDTSETGNSILEIEDAINLLPTNPPAYNIDESTSRFSGAIWYEAIQKTKLILAGLGGIGSNVLYNLARMKPEQIFVYDDDVVETANLSGQMYSSNMIGMLKVNASSQLAQDFSMYNGVVAIPNKFTSSTAPADIMICGFDNMEARKEFFRVWVNHVNKVKHKEKCLYVDGRLNMDEFQVFCITGDDTYNIKRYANEYLFFDRQAEGVQCSMKQTTYCSNMIGSIIVNLFTNFIANSIQPMLMDLPFKTYYSAPMMYLKTES